MGNCGTYFNGHHTPEGPVYLTDDDLIHHLAVFGKSGMGKSTLLRTLFIDLVNKGYGVAVLDPHSGHLVNELAADIPSHRLWDTVYLDVMDRDYAFGINLFEPPATQDIHSKTKKVNQIKSLFRKVADSHLGPLINTWLPVFAHSFIEAGEGTFADITRFLTDTPYRNRLTVKLTNAYAKGYLSRYIDKKSGEISNEQVGSTLRAFGKFLENELILQVVGQPRTSVPFQRILDEDKILLVSLPQDDEDTTALLGTLIFQELFNAGINRTSKKPFAIIVDEAQLVATTDMARSIDELRKRKVGTVLATQRGSKMDDSAIEDALMNVGTFVVFTVDYDEAMKLGRRFPAMEAPFMTYVKMGDKYPPGSPAPAAYPDQLTEAGMFKQPPSHERLMGLKMRHGDGAAAVKIQGQEALIRVTQHPPAGRNGNLRLIREQSRQRYYRLRTEVAHELAAGTAQEPTVFFDDPGPPLPTPHDWPA